MNTKSVQLTEDEVRTVIQYHARQIYLSGHDYSDYIDRMKYLDKRLKDFAKTETPDNKNPTQKEPMSSW